MEQGIGHYVYPRYRRVMDTRENREDINGAYALIGNSAVRNDMIFEDTRACVKAGRTPVILTRYKEQAKFLYENLQKDADHCVESGDYQGQGRTVPISCKSKAGSRLQGYGHYDRTAEYYLWQSGVLPGTY